MTRAHVAKALVPVFTVGATALMPAVSCVADAQSGLAWLLIERLSKTYEGFRFYCFTYGRDVFGGVAG